MRKITIIGLGLIGGSLGLALKRAGVDATIVGHSQHFENASRAKKRGAIDQAEWNLPNAVEGADLVVVAVPVGTMEILFRQIADHLNEGCIVTDVASTKEQVMAWAESALPERVSFVGGHPMAGKETSGIESASVDLFAGCTYCLCPARSATEEAVETITRLVRILGAHPWFLDPVEHDSYVAAISHLPYLAAVSLVRVSGKSDSWRDLSRLAATGFRDTTRVASANTVIYRDICSSNRSNIVRWLELYIAELHSLRQTLLEDPDSIEALLQDAKQIRDNWLQSKQEASATEPEIPSTGDQLKQMIWGNFPIGRHRGKGN